MGLRNGAYAKVWSIENKGKYSEARISTSKKKQDGSGYDQDFGGFVRFVGKAHETECKEGDRIKIVSCEVQNSYNAETKQTYWNPIIWEFENADASPTSNDFVAVPDNAEEEFPFN